MVKIKNPYGETLSFRPSVRASVLDYLNLRGGYLFLMKILEGIFFIIQRYEFIVFVQN